MHKIFLGHRWASGWPNVALVVPPISSHLWMEVQAPHLNPLPFRNGCAYFQLLQRTRQKEEKKRNFGTWFRCKSTKCFPCEAGQRNTPPKKSKNRTGIVHLGHHSLPAESSRFFHFSHDEPPQRQLRALWTIVSSSPSNKYPALVPCCCCCCCCRCPPWSSTLYSYTFGRDIISAQRLSSSPPAATLLISTHILGWFLCDEWLGVLCSNIFNAILLGCVLLIPAPWNISDRWYGLGPWKSSSRAVNNCVVSRKLSLQVFESESRCRMSLSIVHLKNEINSSLQAYES